VKGAIERDPGLRGGVNVAGGKVTHAAVAQGVGMPFTPVEDVLGPQTPQAA
jgi:alanine dehydrogenase